MRDFLQKIFLDPNFWGPVATALVGLWVAQIPALAENETILIGSFVTTIIFIVKKAFDNFSEALVKRADIELKIQEARAQDPFRAMGGG